jgi:fructose-bisphosphate aldolase class I
VTSLAALQQLPRLWALTFSFGRALADPALAAWRGERDRVAAGQLALARRVGMNVAALECRHMPELEFEPEPA